MTYTYIKFKAPVSEDSNEKESAAKKFLKNSIIKALELIIPKANPDFDKEIDNVKEWLIEYDDQNNFPHREIGLGNKGQVILIMPWKDNYGYWTDNEIKLEEFISEFNALKISGDEFETCWNQFETSHQ